MIHSKQSPVLISPRAKSGGRFKAFTLVEVIVVIATIALLVSLLLPALQQSREVGYTVVCASQLRQQFMAFSYYASDCKDALPGTPASGYYTYYWTEFERMGYYGPGQTYPGQIGVNRDPLCRCPGEKGIQEAGFPTGTLLIDYNHPWCPTSYMLNGMMWNNNIFGLPGFNVGTFGLRTADGRTNFGAANSQKNISQVTLLMDARPFTHGWDIPDYTWQVDWSAYYSDGTANYGYAFRHSNNMANMLYFDGHQAPVAHYIKTNTLLFTWKYP